MKQLIEAEEFNSYFYRSMSQSHFLGYNSPPPPSVPGGVTFTVDNPIRPLSSNSALIDYASKTRAGFNFCKDPSSGTEISITGEISLSFIACTSRGRRRPPGPLPHSTPPSQTFLHNVSIKFFFFFGINKGPFNP